MRPIGPIADGELEAVFRIGEDTPWYRAVHQVIDEVEKEQIVESRVFSAQGEATRCVNATGGGAALELLRERLESKRLAALAARGE